MDVYYPGTEELKPDEMRVVACGTGMPSPRPKQAAACWLVELGNGDKFLLYSIHFYIEYVLTGWGADILWLAR